MNSVKITEQLLKVAECSSGITATVSEDGQFYWMNRLGQESLGIDLDNQETTLIILTPIFADSSAKTNGHREGQCHLKTAADPILPTVAYIQPVFKPDNDLCTQAGMDDYLSKPVDFNQLFTTLRRWLA